MKCNSIKDMLLSTCEGFQFKVSNCQHIFCEACFRDENNNFKHDMKPRCPCCKAQFYDNYLTIKEAILLGEGFYLKYMFSLYKQQARDQSFLHNICNQAIEKFENTLKINQANKVALMALAHCLHCDHVEFVSAYSTADKSSLTMPLVQQIEVYANKMYKACFDLFELCRSPDGRLVIEGFDNYYSALADIFYKRTNLAVAVRYLKLAYESCLRSKSPMAASRKKRYLEVKSEFDKLPSLRFAVGDEVEFLHELDTGSEWRLGKVVELYYHERSFDAHFSAPYRLQLLGDSDSADQPPVYAWIKGDLDRYVRKVGVRAYFDPTEAPSTVFDHRPETRYSNSRCTIAFVTIVLHQLSGRVAFPDETFHFTDSDTYGDASLAQAFTHYIRMYRDSETKQLSVDTSTLIENGFSVPIPPQYCTTALNDLMSKAKCVTDLYMTDNTGVAAAPKGVFSSELYCIWIAILPYIEQFSSVCECPFVYFFVRHCLLQGMGVPKQALALYDRMNMQLSREFIRCANPTCELNRLDKSTGQVKFKKCSRCQAVIYCSRECQVAHYPEHKRLCKEHSTG